jgi:hypothetical protein
MKSLAPFNLVRLGLAKGLTPSIWSSPKFNQGYVMCTDVELRAKYRRMVQLVGEGEYGVFYWLEELVSPARARQLADELSIQRPPSSGIPRAVQPVSLDPMDAYADSD